MLATELLGGVVPCRFVREHPVPTVHEGALAREGFPGARRPVFSVHPDHLSGWLAGQNFVTWIYAKSNQDLIEGLKRGRAFTGDPILFNGTMDISTPEDFHMGNVVLTDQKSHDVTLTIHGLKKVNI